MRPTHGRQICCPLWAVCDHRRRPSGPLVIPRQCIIRFLYAQSGPMGMAHAGHRSRGRTPPHPTPYPQEKLPLAFTWSTLSYQTPLLRPHDLSPINESCSGLVPAHIICSSDNVLRQSTSLAHGVMAKTPAMIDSNARIRILADRLTVV